MNKKSRRRRAVRTVEKPKPPAEEKRVEGRAQPLLWESSLTIISDVVKELEKIRDTHQSNLSGQIERLRLTYDLAVKMNEVTVEAARRPRYVF